MTHYTKQLNANDARLTTRRLLEGVDIIILDTTVFTNHLKLKNFIPELVSVLKRDGKQVLISQATRNTLIDLKTHHDAVTRKIADDGFELVTSLVRNGYAKYFGAVNASDTNRTIYDKVLSARSNRLRTIVISRKSELVKQLLGENKYRRPGEYFILCKRINVSGNLEDFDFSGSGTKPSSDYLAKRFGIY